MVTTLNPTTPVPLVTASFGADQLAGRQLWVQFPPAAADLGSALALTVDQIMAFRPLLYLGGRDVDLTADPSLASVGPFITLHGDVLANDNGTITINNRDALRLLAARRGRRGDRGFGGAGDQGGRVHQHRPVGERARRRRQPGAGAGGLGLHGARGRCSVSLLLTGAPSQTLRVMIILDYDGPLQTGDDPLQLAQALDLCNPRRLSQRRGPDSVLGHALRRPPRRWPRPTRRWGPTATTPGPSSAMRPPGALRWSSW